MNKMYMSLLVSSLVLASEADLQKQLDELRSQMKELKVEQSQTNETLVEELVSLKDEMFMPASESTSVSSLGVAASKVYHTKSVVSIGGYGEYKMKKFTEFKNGGSDEANSRRKKLETNVVRFVPYIGFRFNDWIIMNTEIEFEDGGAKTVDDGNDYKYAIVEFSYIDFMFAKEYSLRIGHVLVPFGNINLNHEPVAFLTAERPTVETIIIPSTWHTNGALLFGQVDDFEYYLGTVSAPDASDFEEGTFIQQGRRGAKQTTNDFGIVARAQYNFGSGFVAGASFYHSNTGGDLDYVGIDADVSVTMTEVHATYKENGWDISALAVMGDMGDFDKIPGTQLSSKVYGAYVTAGYDILNSNTQRLLPYVEVEHLNMDANDDTTLPDNHKFNEYTLGFAYFPDPHVVIKADYWMKDYNSDATLADEEALTASLGFIF